MMTTTTPPTTTTLCVVDTFTTERAQGSPVAVVLDGRGISEDRMRAIARAADLPTTTFVLPPSGAQHGAQHGAQRAADYRLRIIARHGDELPFAGHSSMGSAFALLDAGVLPRRFGGSPGSPGSPGAFGELVQECAAGLVTIRYNAGNVFQFRIDGLAAERVGAAGRLGLGLGLELGLADCFRGGHIAFADAPLFKVSAGGPRWLVAEARGTRSALLRAEPVLESIYALSAAAGATGVCVFAVDADADADGGAVEVRSFAQGFGEEFVCGSGNAAVAYVREQQAGPGGGPGGGARSGYTATQGAALGRPGTVNVTYDNGVWIGGPCVVERVERVERA